MNEEPLIINSWAAGIGESHHVGNALVKNADIVSFPGAVKVAKKPQTYFHSINELTFTADSGTSTCTASGVIEANGANIGGAAVYFTTTGTLPSGLSTGTTYYLIQVSSTTFKVATSYANSVGSTPGTSISIGDAGTGVHTMHQVEVGTIKWIQEDPRTNFRYMLSSNGRVWFATGSTAYLLNNAAIDTPASGVANASGNGLAISPFSSTSATYLFVFRNNAIDVIDVFGTTQIEALSWSNAWKTMNTGAGSSNSHEAIKAQDDAIYFCDDRYVGSIIETVGMTFAPGSSSTYIYNNQALDLPALEIAECLEELGTNLLIGGSSFNKIYPWNRIASSFENPIDVPEYSIKKLKNIGGNVYILAGSLGNIYSTQGTYAKHVKKIPTHVVNSAYSVLSNPVTWGGIAAANGTLLFGVGGQTSGSSGVYRLYPDGRLIHDNTPSTGSTNATALWAKNDFYVMGYSGGADNFSLATQYDSNYDTVLQSQLFHVGTKTHKGKYSEIEAQIANPASSGNIRIGYRLNTTSSFTTIATFNMDSSSVSFKEDIGLIDLEKIQIQAELQGNMELISIILYP